MRLKDRVALITGGASGIGEATVLRFAEEGAKVAINDVSAELANGVAEKVKSNGGQAIVCIADVTEKTEVEAMMKQVMDEFGKLDILVNNAGINRDAFAKKMTEEQWDKVLDVNLKGTFLCAQAAFGPMSNQKSGRIINTASIGALGNPGQANYSASKMGVIGLTKTLALEGARYNINVNCVSPGATSTPMMSKVPPEFIQKIKEKIQRRE
jgi:NAD(P)-dependent dehydrogenase (short-subunit alcohol dehydrogenase family)